jgi:hypothetical protein
VNCKVILGAGMSTDRRNPVIAVFDTFAGQIFNKVDVLALLSLVEGTADTILHSASILPAYFWHSQPNCSSVK